MSGMGNGERDNILNALPKHLRDRYLDKDPEIENFREAMREICSPKPGDGQLSLKIKAILRDGFESS